MVLAYLLYRLQQRDTAAAAAANQVDPATAEQSQLEDASSAYQYASLLSMAGSTPLTGATGTVISSVDTSGATGATGATGTTIDVSDTNNLMAQIINDFAGSITAQSSTQPTVASMTIPTLGGVSSSDLTGIPVTAEQAAAESRVPQFGGDLSAVGNGGAAGAVPTSTFFDSLVSSAAVSCSSGGATPVSAIGGGELMAGLAQLARIPTGVPPARPQPQTNAPDGSLATPVPWLTGWGDSATADPLGSIGSGGYTSPSSSSSGAAGTSSSSSPLATLEKWAADLCHAHRNRGRALSRGHCVYRARRFVARRRGAHVPRYTTGDLEGHQDGARCRR